MSYHSSDSIMLYGMVDPKIGRYMGGFYLIYELLKAENFL